MAAPASSEPPSGGRVSRAFLAALLAFALLVALVGPLAASTMRSARAQAPQGQDVTYITRCTNITKPGYYVLSSNISGTQATRYCIGVFASDVVIYGSGHRLRGPRNHEGVGIYVAPGSTNVTIEDVVVTSYYGGIFVNSSGVRVVDSIVGNNWGDGVYVYGDNDTVVDSNVSYNGGLGVYVGGNSDSVVDSTVSGNSAGVYVYGDSDSVVDSTVSGMHSRSFHLYGVYVEGSNDSVVDSTVSYNIFGISVKGSDNSFVGDRFLGDGLFLAGPYYEVVANDTVNGRPLVYLYDASNVTVRDAGQVIAFDSRELRVVGVNVSNATLGVLLWDVNDSVIDYVVASGNWYGVYLYGDNNSIADSNVSHNVWYGVYVYGDNYSIVNSTVSYNQYGIYLNDSSGTLITGNIISNNRVCGLLIDGSRGDLIYNNLFNNTNNACIYNSYAYWNVSLRPGKNIVGGDMIGGNAWLSPSGDGFSQVTPALPNDPYICDEPYVINGNNTDYLPLKYPLSSASMTSTTSTTTTTTTAPTTTTTTPTATARLSLPSIALAATVVVVVVVAAVALLLRGRR